MLGSAIQKPAYIYVGAVRRPTHNDLSEPRLGESRDSESLETVDRSYVHLEEFYGDGQEPGGRDCLFDQ